MPIYVQRESLNTKSRHVTLTWMDRDENQRIVASSDSLPTIDVNHLRLHEGRAFYLYKVYPYSAGLAAGASADIDAFVPPKPYPSWILNNDTVNWEAPVPMPDDGLMYSWDEDSQSWVANEQFITSNMSV